MTRLWLMMLPVAIVVGFSACGKPAKACDPDVLMPSPELCPDRDSLGFAMEFRSGTFIGQAPTDSLALHNGGLKDLVISSITTSGDSAFAYTYSQPASGGVYTVPPNKILFVQVTFTPTQAKLYSGAINVVSNAENSPNKSFQVAGCGVPTDGGTSPCYGDAG